MKNRHVGTSILELNVCGAIPPYNELLAGKLVALLMLSPTVLNDYRQRYGNRASDILSRMKGEEVIRPADLAFIGTISLYNDGIHLSKEEMSFTSGMPYNLPDYLFHPEKYVEQTGNTNDSKLKIKQRLYGSTCLLAA